MFSHFILIISDSTLHWMQCILKDFTIVLAVPLNPVMGFKPTLSDGYFYLWICICVFVYSYLCYFICVLCWRWPGSPLWWVWRLNYQPLLSDSILSAVLLRSAWIWENSGNRCEKSSKHVKRLQKMWKGFKRCLFFWLINCSMPFVQCR